MTSISEMIQGAIKAAIIEKYEAAETEELKNDLINKLGKVEWSSVTLDVFEKMKDTFETLKGTMFEHVYYKKQEDSEYLARLNQKWSRAFTSSEAMYILVLETVSNLNSRINNLADNERAANKNKYDALKFIHGRVLQQYLEVITLMINGLADGAFSRWRSMYELGVIASFIAQETEDVAKAYIESSTTDKRYDWEKASSVFKNRKKGSPLYFRDIEKVSTFPTYLLDEQYNLASSIIHPSSSGTFGRLAHADDGPIPYVPVGTSDYGMTVPGECSAITLAQVTTLLLNVYKPNEEDVISLYCINQWVDFLVAEYFHAHDEAFPNYEPKMPLLMKKKTSL